MASNTHTKAESMGNSSSAITEVDQAATENLLQQTEPYLNISRPQRFTSVQTSSRTVSENYYVSTSVVAERTGNKYTYKELTSLGYTATVLEAVQNTTEYNHNCASHYASSTKFQLTEKSCVVSTEMLNEEHRSNDNQITDLEHSSGDVQALIKCENYTDTNYYTAKEASKLTYHSVPNNTFSNALTETSHLEKTSQKDKNCLWPTSYALNPVLSSAETFPSWTTGELHQSTDTESEINILNSIQADGAEHAERNPGRVCCRCRGRQPVQTCNIRAKSENRQNIAMEYNMQKPTHQHKPYCNIQDEHGYYFSSKNHQESVGRSGQQTPTSVKSRKTSVSSSPYKQTTNHTISNYEPTSNIQQYCPYSIRAVALLQITVTNISLHIMYQQKIVQLLHHTVL
jgi:hypothetical protein